VCNALPPQGNSGNFIELVKGALSYTGPVDLTQYYIKSYNMTGNISSFTQGNNGIKVDIVLSRRLLNQEHNYKFNSND
jgi:hypothetical protein